MKIHSISLLNLNSLKGAFSIDFTSAPLLECGLFAITGPTGAGKTTLLDALTLALYGEVARAASMADEVMSYGTGECYAEVVFETARGKYKAKWSRARARQKSTGALQAVKRELAEWPSGTILATRIADVNSTILEKTGLNKDQFLKSVLLAQGDFTAFLKARSTARAELLEKMTSTEHYKVLSQRAFRRKREEEEKENNLKASLEGIRLLSEEEERTKQETVTSLQIEINTWNAKKSSINGELIWALKLADIESAISRSEENLVAATQRKEQNALLFQSWALHNIVLPIEVKLTQLEQAETQIDVLLRSNSEIENQLQGLSSNLAIDSERKSKAEEDFKLYETVTSSKRPVLIEAIATLATIQSDRGQLKDIVSQIENNSSELTQIQQRLGERSTTIAQKKDILVKLNIWLEENKADRDLSSEVSYLRDQYTLLITENGKLATAKSQISSLLTSIEQSKIDAAEQTDLVDRAARTISGLEEKLKSSLSFLYVAKQQLAIDYQKTNDEIVAVEQLVTGNRARANALQFFVTHHENLVDDKPCPLCGSEDHPNANQDLGTLKADIQTLNGDIVNQENQIASSRRTLTGISNNFALIDSVDLSGLEATDFAGVIVPATFNIQNAVQESQAIPSQIAQIRVQIDTGNQKVFSIASAIQESQQKIAELEIAVQKNVRDIDSILGIFKSYSAKYHVQYTQSKEQDVIGQLETRLNTFNQSVQKYQIGISELKGLEDQQGLDQVSLTQKQTDRTRLQQQYTTLQQSIDSRQSDVAKTYPSSFDSPSEYLDEINNTEEAKRNSMQAAKAAFDNTSHQIETQNALKLANDGHLESAKNTQLRLHKDINDFIAQNNLPASHAEVRGLLIETGRRASVGETIRMIEQSIRDSSVVIEASKKELEQHTAGKSSTKQIDEIRAQLQEADNTIDSLNQQYGEVSNELETNSQNKARFSDILSQIEAQHVEVLKWSELSNLIGSADGNKFAKYAQSISLDRLLTFANDHLSRLSDRYQLRREPTDYSEMSLTVVDRYQANNVRDTGTLSGGESFLVSLGLALGLADMASRNTRIDSLFIDEGFGTLDEDALSDAIGTLENLHSRGKTIGVISHVEQLKSRIQTQIVVSKKGSGYSGIEIFPTIQTVA